jgi:hypothetical protein
LMLVPVVNAAAYGAGDQQDLRRVHMYAESEWKELPHEREILTNYRVRCGCLCLDFHFSVPARVSRS